LSCFAAHSVERYREEAGHAAVPVALPSEAALEREPPAYEHSDSRPAPTLSAATGDVGLGSARTYPHSEEVALFLVDRDVEAPTMLHESALFARVVLFNKHPHVVVCRDELLGAIDQHSQHRQVAILTDRAGADLVAALAAERNEQKDAPGVWLCRVDRRT